MGLPGDTDARLEVAIGGRHQTVVDAVIVGENESLRSIWITCALLTRGKDRAPAARDLQGEVRVPAQPGGESKIRTQLDLVLTIKANHIAGLVAALARPLAQTAEITQQKVGQGKTRVLAVEADRCIYAAAVKFETVAVHDVRSSDDGVPAYRLGDGIGKPPVAAACIVGVSGEGVETQPPSVEHISIERRQTTDVAFSR